MYFDYRNKIIGGISLGQQMDKIEGIYREVHEAQTQYGRLLWTQYTAGYDFGLKGQYQKITSLLKNEKSYELVREALEKEQDPLNKRKLQLVFNLFKPYHLSQELNELDEEIQGKVNDLSKLLNQFRYTFQGKEVSSVELGQVMSRDDDKNRRREAFFAKNQINQPMVDAGFLDLISLRKSYAKEYGSANYIAHQLEMNELDNNLFCNWLPELHQALPAMDKARGGFAEQFLHEDRIMPWDEQYIDAKIAPLLNQEVDMSNYFGNINKLFSLFGFDISGYNITYDIFPRKNKSEWGYNFPIETAKDSRILANVKNKFHEYGVLLHETGHAVHSFLLEPEELILNTGVSGIISEGIANLFQGFLYSPQFSGSFFSGSESAAEQFSRLKEYRRTNSLRAISRIFFDHSFYLNEASSLDDVYQLYWRNHKKVLQEEPFGEEPPWAFTIHYTTHPIYLHNYFMGDVTCEMLKQVFEKKHGAGLLEKPEAFGNFLLDEVIRPSGSLKFGDLFRKISGEEFSLKFMRS